MPLARIAMRTEPAVSALSSHCTTAAGPTELPVLLITLCADQDTGRRLLLVVAQGAGGLQIGFTFASIYARALRRSSTVIT